MDRINITTIVQDQSIKFINLIVASYTSLPFFYNETSQMQIRYDGQSGFQNKVLD